MSWCSEAPAMKLLVTHARVVLPVAAYQLNMEADDAR